MDLLTLVTAFGLLPAIRGIQVNVRSILKGDIQIFKTMDATIS